MERYKEYVMPVTWSYDEVLKETQSYFGGDELAASAVVGNYCLCL